jgi:hypothetical protein
MGNILNPSPGDLVDRQTILQIKIEHCGIEGQGHAPTSVEILEQTAQKSVTRTKVSDLTEVNIQPFLIEHEAIQQRLELDWFSKLTPKQGDEFEELMGQLRHYNSELWKLEDQARVLRAAPRDEVYRQTIVVRKANTLDAITTANDTRAALVKAINKLWGIEIVEKLYV